MDGKRAEQIVTRDKAEQIFVLCRLDGTLLAADNPAQDRLELSGPFQENTNLLDCVSSEDRDKVGSTLSNLEQAKDGAPELLVSLLIRKGKSVRARLHFTVLNIENETVAAIGMRLDGRRSRGDDWEADRAPGTLYSTLFNEAEDGMFLHPMSSAGPPAKFREVNDKACDLLGYSRDELLNLTPADVVAGYTDDQIEADRASLLKSGQLMMEKSLLTRDGRQLTAELSVRKVELNGQSYVFTVARDISRRKWAESQLKMAQLSIDRSGSTILGADEDGRIVFVNDSPCRLLGYSMPELLGMFIFDIDTTVTEKDWPKVREALKGGNNNLYESEYRRKDGSTFPVIVSATYQDAGDVARFIYFASDISDRKWYEKELGKALSDMSEDRRALEKKTIALEEVLSTLEERKRIMFYEISEQLYRGLQPIFRSVRRSSKLTPDQVTEAKSILTSLKQSIDETTSTPFADLTTTELRVCDLIASGYTSKEIAERLHISFQTVNKHRFSIRRKLGLNHRKVNLASYLRTKTADLSRYTHYLPNN